MAENFGVQGRGLFYEEAGAIRDVVQNHLLQILANLTMEPPAGTRQRIGPRREGQSAQGNRAARLRQRRPRAIYRLPQARKAWRLTSNVETFAALRLAINSWRWHGVPFYIRAGKELPVTCTEVLVRFRKPPPIYPQSPAPNYLRFRISPEIQIALGVMVKSPVEELAGKEVELLADHHPSTDEMDAYERLLGDAMKGNATLFARQDYVEEAWRIVDPVLTADTAVHEYAPNTWGPVEAARQLAPPGGWHNPIVSVETGSEAH